MNCEKIRVLLADKIKRGQSTSPVVDPLLRKRWKGGSDLVEQSGSGFLANCGEVHSTALALFKVLWDIPGDGRIDGNRPGDGSTGSVAGSQVIPDGFDFDQAVFPALVLLDTVNRRRDTRDHRCMGWPGDCRHLADDAIRPLTFTHQAAQIRDLESEFVAIPQISMVQAVHRQQYEMLRLGLEPAAEKKKYDK